MWRRRLMVIGPVFFWLLSTCPALAQTDADLDGCLQTLKDAGVGTDAESLLSFFRKRTLSKNDQERLASLVRTLGDESFEVREQASRTLMAAGSSAIPYLRVALQDPDPEIVSRVRDCLEGVDFAQNVLRVTAAARVLAERNPPEATAVLLGYLPFARFEFEDEEAVVDLFFGLLQKVGIRDGKSDLAIEKSMKHPDPLCRAAAAHVLREVKNPQDREEVVGLLGDLNARVRFEAAVTIAGRGDRRGVPVLLNLLTDGPPSIAWLAEDLLTRLPANSPINAGLGTLTPQERQRCREEWETWWKKNQESADLSRFVQQEPYYGRTLICEFDDVRNGQGRVVELSKDNKDRWEITGLQGPNDAQILPGGRVLVAERVGGRVTERDQKGTILWEYEIQSPIACQRLPGSQTLITTFDELLEVSKDKKVIHRYTHKMGFRQAIALRNNHILFVTADGQIGELGPDRKLLRNIKPKSYGNGASFWASLEVLAGGRILAVFGGANKVVELDGTGAVVWECSQPSPVFATRLRNGNTLIACFEAKTIVEVNREGKEVGKTSLMGRPFTVRRY